MPIRKVKARQILDSSGEPSVEVDLVSDIGLFRCSVSSSIFPAEYQAKDRRDEDEAVYSGRSVYKVVETINNVIAPEILKSKLDVHQQREIDLLLQSLDGTADKSKLGRNAMLGVSIAVCKAAAAKRALPLYKYVANLCDNSNNCHYLPVPVFNLVSGGRLARNELIYQEFHILPIGASNFAEAMRMGVEIYRTLERQMAEEEETEPPLNVSNDGSFVPLQIGDDKEMVGAIDAAIKEAGFEGKVKIGIDVSATVFARDDGMYELEYKSEDSDPDSYVDGDALREQYVELIGEYPNIISLEDPLGKEDLENYPTLAEAMPGTQLVLDEAIAMNLQRIEEAVESQAANSVIIRLSQVATISEAIQCVKSARSNGYGIVVSAGDLETEDNFIADFAVGVSASQFKGGAPRRTERVAKYNQILRIEEELGQEARYVGKDFINPFGKS